MIREAIAKLVKNENLTESEAEASMHEIMSGKAGDAQIAAFLIGLRMKGESVDEITACARVMRQKATRINVFPDIDMDREDINIDRETIIDTCGTGGTGTNTFNISTATAFVVAACGIKVAKHGNRAASSACGSADVLENLGVNLEMSPEKVAEAVNKLGIGFLYAPLLHSAMKYAIGPRRELAVRTIFNILGPLTNPASASAQVLGVYAPALTETLAHVLLKLGTRKAFVVHGEDSLDEITITGRTRISELSDGRVKTYTITPENYGFKRATLYDIRGGDADQNAKIIRAVLQGERGPRRDIVVLNAAFALLAAEKVTDIKKAIQLARQVIDKGSAYQKLDELKEFTRNE